MAKKDTKKKSKTSGKKSRKPVLWIIGAISVAMVVLLVSGNILFSGSSDNKGKSFTVQGNKARPVLESSSGSGDKKGKSFRLQGSETRTVLNPSLFTGQARAAYTVAKKYPEVMNQVFCYCFCDAPPFNHKTLLSCFTDRHGAG